MALTFKGIKSGRSGLGKSGKLSMDELCELSCSPFVSSAANPAFGGEGSRVALISDESVAAAPLFIYPDDKPEEFWVDLFRIFGATFGGGTLNEVAREAALAAVLLSPFKNGIDLAKEVAKNSGASPEIVLLDLSPTGRIITRDPASKHAPMLGDLIDQGDANLQSRLFMAKSWDLDQEIPEEAELIRAIFCQIYGFSGKAMANYVEAYASAKLHNKVFYTNRFITNSLVITAHGATQIVDIIRASGQIRHLLVAEILASGASTGGGGAIGEIIRHHAVYIAGTQMFQYYVTVQNVMKSRRALASISGAVGEARTLIKLMRLQARYGALGPFVKFLCLPDHNQFSGNAYPSLFSMALGIEDVKGKTSHKYVHDISYVNKSLYELGKEIGRASFLEMDQSALNELEVTAEEAANMDRVNRAALKALMDDDYDSDDQEI
ncbi:nucleoprotein [Wenzhou pacific spadenose shark paramyxovirus]|uniref:Nucleocapsid n=1 Tax=Wenzhou pacific spadenose shark paramyxovirus TaxID=2116452 RepID=A0A2P1GMX1_9MONO|nr:nucleoprotein [Wenzhou pacific spadenose shark paramyxovirus]AVM87353.1 nucleoprotein [Wenzhou pacific spadenose shark paramyxovirus]